MKLAVHKKHLGGQMLSVGPIKTGVNILQNLDPFNKNGVKNASDHFLGCRSIDLFIY